jgi:hypothetical protein
MAFPFRVVADARSYAHPIPVRARCCAPVHKIEQDRGWRKMKKLEQFPVDQRLGQIEDHGFSGFLSGHALKNTLWRTFLLFL